jgi:hypothetical protein
MLSLLHCNVMELVVLVLTGPGSDLKLHRMSVHLLVQVFLLKAHPCFNPKLGIDNFPLRKSLDMGARGKLIVNVLLYQSTMESSSIHTMDPPKPSNGQPGFMQFYILLDSLEGEPGV